MHGCLVGALQPQLELLDNSFMTEQRLFEFPDCVFLVTAGRIPQPSHRRRGCGYFLKARFAHAAEHPIQDAGERRYEKQKIDCDFHSRLHLDATLLLSALIVLFSSLRGLDLACSPKQSPHRAYSEHDAYDSAKREIDRARIEQNLKGVTHIIFSTSLNLNSSFPRERCWPDEFCLSERP
jgi:hypothetical protein